MFLPWNDKYSVGVAEFDKQHMELVRIINSLADAMSKGKSNDILSQILKDLISYTATHFVSEENKMKVYSYPYYTRHKQEHDELVDEVLAFQKDFENGRIALSVMIMRFLKDWLVKHIMDSDKQYGEYLNQKGVN